MARRTKKEGNKEGARAGNVIYGISPVLEALRADGGRIERVLVAEGKQHQRIAEIKGLAREMNVPIRIVPRAVISGLLAKDANHQGVAAQKGSAGYADPDELIAEILADEMAICLVLDGIEDPHNLGAIIRTAECAGVKAVFIPDRRSAGLNDTVAKTSAGAVEFVKVARVTNVNRLIDDLKDHGFWIIGAAGEADSDHFKWDWNRRCALVLGSEGSGLHRLTREKCDMLVKIPMYGRIESLNVSVATGVLLFEALRQRMSEETRSEET
jgi:23S rRNA (guanosine2251-2'-O)-methyltransferase